MWRGASGFVVHTGGEIGANPEPIPDAIKGDFNGFVLDRDRLHLRTLKRFDVEPSGRRRSGSGLECATVTAEMLQAAASEAWARWPYFHLDQGGNIQIPPPSTASPKARIRVEAGKVPPESYRFDPALRFYTFFQAVVWETGKAETGGIGVITRPSKLYAVLFATLGDDTEIVLRNILIGIAIFFGLIELTALFIGVRLSRGMTRSVADLYRATGYVNRGDLEHRIHVHGWDQMASLEQSFNSMTESLARLMGEQKEKQRLESELAIGHEVQNSLFPRNFAGSPSLEVYGVCQPARSVSGDYYDFIPLGADRLMLAVGDISGKGISAALLMATVHAFVRAYALEPLRGEPSASDRRMYYRGDGTTQSELTPAMLMTTLNYQLFRGTPPEKYATMFLACYDAALRQLKYSNAGHLSPILLSADGNVSRLDTSGTVVGLFDGATYDESTVAMLPGDIFIAFTDGVTEPENASGEFGEERLIELVKATFRRPALRASAMPLPKL